jgi:hypothetical protein
VIIENELAIFWGLGSDNDPRTVKLQGTKRNSNSTSFTLCVHPTGSSVCYKYPITREIPQGIVDVSKSDLYERPVALVNTSVYVGWNYGVVAGDVSKLVAVKSKNRNENNSWKYEISQTTSLDDVLQVHPSKKKLLKMRLKKHSSLSWLRFYHPVFSWRLHLDKLFWMFRVRAILELVLFIRTRKMLFEFL